MKYLPLKSTMNGLLFVFLVLITRTAFLFGSIFVGFAVVIVDAGDVVVVDVEVVIVVVVVVVVRVVGIIFGVVDVVVVVVFDVICKEIVFVVDVVVVRDVKQPVGWSWVYIILK